MLDKARIGTRYVCYQCGCKFYDFNLPKATCPDCAADQAEAPIRDIKSLLSNKGRIKELAKERREEEAELATAAATEEEDANADDAEVPDEDEEVDELD